MPCMAATKNRLEIRLADRRRRKYLNDFKNNKTLEALQHFREVYPTATKYDYNMKGPSVM